MEINLSIPYQFSKFCKYFKKDEIVALYHSLRIETVYLKKEIYNLIRVFEDGMPPTSFLGMVEEPLRPEVSDLIRALIDKRLLVPEKTDEDWALEQVRKELLGQPQPYILYLLLTDLCNMRCNYCYIMTRKKKGLPLLSMNRGTVKMAIDLFLRSIRNPIYDRPKQIIFYGGEPILNFETLKYAVEYLDELTSLDEEVSKIERQLVTNGTLITEEIASFLAKNHISTGISIDGPIEIIDAHRKPREGVSLAQAVIKGYKILIGKGVDVGISCTLVPENIKNFTNTLEFFLHELNIQGGICFNILMCQENVPTDEEYAYNASRCIIKAFEAFRRKGIYEERMMRKMNSFVEKIITPYDCGGCGNQIVVSTSGDVGLCTDRLNVGDYVVSHVSNPNFDPRRNPIFIEWSSRSPLSMLQCYGCEALGICGGGCPANAKIIDGSIWEVDRRFCIHSKMTLEWLIWDQYSQIQKNRLTL